MRENREPPANWWEGPDGSIDVDVESTRSKDVVDHAEAMARMPSLAKPFAAFGAAAGFFAILALGAFRPAAREVFPLIPMIATATVGAIAGLVLHRWQRLHHPLTPREFVMACVGVVTASAGAASGGIVALVTWGVDGFVRFTVGGALVGLFFLPSCLVVFDAAKRAGRGRFGSLVAATDRRTVLSTVLAGIGFAGAVQVPALLNAESSNELAPLGQLLLSILTCLGSLLAIVVLQRRDRRDRAALDAFVKDAPWLDRAEDDDAELPQNAVDLGIGAHQWTRSMDTSYRTSGKAEVLVKGSVEDAKSAFDEGVRRRHRSLVIALCGLTAVTLSFALRLAVYL